MAEAERRHTAEMELLRSTNFEIERQSFATLAVRLRQSKLFEGESFSSTRLDETLQLPNGSSGPHYLDSLALTPKSGPLLGVNANF